MPNDSVLIAEITALRQQLVTVEEELEELKPIAYWANKALSEISESSDPSVAVLKANARALVAETTLKQTQDLLLEIQASCAVEFDDARIKYLTVQIDRPAWETLRAYRPRIFSSRAEEWDGVMERAHPSSKEIKP